MRSRGLLVGRGTQPGRRKVTSAVTEASPGRCRSVFCFPYSVHARSGRLGARTKRGGGREADGDGFDSGGVEVVLFASVAVAASLTGTGGRDVIEGTDRAEAISGLGGGDTLNGLGNKDTVKGGYGVDEVSGGFGADEAYGNAGDDYLIDAPDTGTDLLYGSYGRVSTCGTSLLSKTWSTAAPGGTRPMWISWTW
jgi:hypothetical protein